VFCRNIFYPEIFYPVFLTNFIPSLLLCPCHNLHCFLHCVPYIFVIQDVCLSVEHPVCKLRMSAFEMSVCFSNCLSAFQDVYLLLKATYISGILLAVCLSVQTAFLYLLLQLFICSSSSLYAGPVICLLFKLHICFSAAFMLLKLSVCFQAAYQLFKLRLPDGQAPYLLDDLTVLQVEFCVSSYHFFRFHSVGPPVLYLSLFDCNAIIDSYLHIWMSYRKGPEESAEPLNVPAVL
jgi:hypothetical protein